MKFVPTKEFFIEHIGDTELTALCHFEGIIIVQHVFEDLLGHASVHETGLMNSFPHDIQHLFDEDRFEILAHLVELA